MDRCNDPMCEPCQWIRASEQNVNNKSRELNRQALFSTAIRERASEKPKNINRQIKEIVREANAKKREINRDARDEHKFINQQVRQRCQQAISAFTEQKMREAEEEARRRREQAQAAAQLVPDPEKREDLRHQLRGMIQQLESMQDPYPSTYQSKPSTLDTCGPDCGPSSTSTSRPAMSYPKTSIPTTFYSCCPDCGSPSTSASRLPTTYPEPPRLPSRPRFVNIQQQRPPQAYSLSNITPSSFCCCPTCLVHIHEMTTRPSRRQKSKGDPRGATVSQPEEEEVEAETPTCSGAVNEEEDVWEKYVRDDPKAKTAASKKEFHAKRDRYPKRVHIVSQDEEEGESETDTSTVVEDEKKGAFEDGEKVVVELKVGKESEEEKRIDLEEDTEDQDQVGDDKLFTCSSEEEIITLVSGEDAN